MELTNTISYIRSLRIENDRASFVICLYDTLKKPPMDKPILELTVEGCEDLAKREKEITSVSEYILWGLDVLEIDNKYRLDFYDDYDITLSIFCASYSINYRKFNEEEWVDLVSSFERERERQQDEMRSLSISVSNIQTKIWQRIDKQQKIINQTERKSPLKQRAIQKLEIYSEIKNILDNELPKNA